MVSGSSPYGFVLDPQKARRTPIAASSASSWAARPLDTASRLAVILASRGADRKVTGVTSVPSSIRSVMPARKRQLAGEAQSAEQYDFSDVAVLDCLLQIPQVGRAWDPNPGAYVTGIGRREVPRLGPGRSSEGSRSPSPLPTMARNASEDTTSAFAKCSRAHVDFPNRRRRRGRSGQGSGQESESRVGHQRPWCTTSSRPRRPRRSDGESASGSR